MAELLERLLSRQRRRSPFSDVMGPDPLESQAAMDAAQGANVSTPPPVSARGPVADAGEGILVSGGGGGGNPFRLAGGGGAAPVQTAVRQGTSGKTQATQTQCPGGKCPTPRRVMSAPSNYQIIDDGGFPVASSTGMSGPVVSSGAPVMSGAPSASVYDLQGVVDSARQQEVMGNPSGRALEQNIANLGLTSRAMDQTDRIIEFNTSTRDMAAAQAKERLTLEASKVASENAINLSTARMNEGMAQISRESSSLGRFETEREIIDTMIREGGNPENAARALAVQSQPLQVGADGKPIPPAQVAAISQKDLDTTRTMAYGAAGIHLIVQSEQMWDAANQVSQGSMSEAYPPLQGETKEGYAQRVYAQMAGDRGQNFARAADQIISGLQQTAAWKTGSWSEVGTDLSNHVGMTLNQYMTKKYLEAQQDEIAALPEARRAEYMKGVEFRAQADAGKVFHYLEVETYAAFMKSRGGQYDPNKTYLDNMRAAPASYFGGDKKPTEPPPADSNNTMPNLPAGVAYP